MASLSHDTLVLTRRDLSAIARNLAKATGLSHAQALGMVAKAAGFSDGNALMGALKSATPPAADPLAVTAASQPDTAGYLYRLNFPFVSDDDGLEALDLEAIAYEITEGGAVGAWGGNYRLTKTPIDAATLSRLAILFGSTPDFFPGLAEGNTTDDD